jgi:hypothetical protein
MAIDWKNPYVLGGAALIGVLILMAGRGGGGNQGAGIASQSVATGANVQLAALNTQYAMARDQVIGGIDIASMQAKSTNLGMALSYLTNADNNRIASQQISAGVAVNKDNNSTLFRLTGLNADVTKQLAQVNSDTQISLANINAQASMRIAEQQRGAAADAAGAQAGMGLQNNIFGFLGKGMDMFSNFLGGGFL